MRKKIDNEAYEIDNFNEISELLFGENNRPLSENEFYFLQILVRGKDGNHVSGNNKNRLVKYYCIRSKEQLMNLKEEIKGICKTVNGRAYIHPTRRDAIEVANLCLILTSKTFVSKNWTAFRGTYSTACGQSAVSNDKKFIVDLDGFSIGTNVMNDIKKFINSLRGKGDDKIVGEIETKNGCHYIILRTQWLYSNHGKNFFKTMFEKLWNKKHSVVNDKDTETLHIVNDQFGTPTSAREVAIAIFHIINTNKENRSLSKTGIYNFRNEGIATWYDFAWAISDMIDEYEKIDPPAHIFINPISTSKYVKMVEEKGKKTAKRPLFAVLNTEKFKNTFGFVPLYWRQELEVVFAKEIQNIRKEN